MLTASSFRRNFLLTTPIACLVFSVLIYASMIDVDPYNLGIFSALLFGFALVIGGMGSLFATIFAFCTYIEWNQETLKPDLQIERFRWAAVASPFALGYSALWGMRGVEVIMLGNIGGFFLCALAFPVFIVILYRTWCGLTKGFQPIQNNVHVSG